MKTMSLSEAKSKLSSLVDAIEGRDEEIVITRNGRPAAVMVSADEFDSWKETMAVRADPELTTEIRKGLRSLKAGKARLYTLEELLG